MKHFVGQAFAAMIGCAWVMISLVTQGTESWVAVGAGQAWLIASWVLGEIGHLRSEAAGHRHQVTVEVQRWP